jgi:hypothetical protein
MIINYSKSKNRYIKYKRLGQFLRYIHIKFNLLTSNSFLRILRKAEDCYYQDGVLKMPKFNFTQLNKYNIDLIINNQKHYFNELYKDFFAKVPQLLCNQDFVTLGFVIKISNRDTIRKYLFDKNIFPPIHWILSDEIDKTLFDKSDLLSSEILTIPLIGLDGYKFQYLSENLNYILNNENIS